MEEIIKLSFELALDPDAPIDVEDEEDVEDVEDEEDEEDVEDEEDEEDEEDGEEEDPATLLPLSSILLATHRHVRVFQIKSKDEHCIRIMDEFRHPNILRLESIIRSAEVGSDHTLFIQQYEGNLQTYISNGLENGPDGFEIGALQTIFRQIITAISYLIERNLHHDGFSLQSTYYSIKNGGPLIKLANFKTCPPEFLIVFGQKSVWTNDWDSVGLSIDEVVKLVIKHKPNSFVGELKEVATILKDSSFNPCEMKEIALQQAFFWTPQKREAVFKCKVPRLLADNDFYEMAAKSFSCPKDFGWDDHEFDGLVRIMNAYRVTVHNSKYTGMIKNQYLKFVSGCYAHEMELKRLYSLQRTVDSIFREYDPDICLRLMEVVKAFEKKGNRG